MNQRSAQRDVSELLPYGPSPIANACKRVQLTATERKGRALAVRWRDDKTKLFRALPSETALPQWVTSLGRLPLSR